MNGHRNLCRINDFESSEGHKMREDEGGDSVFIISECYNLSLFDLYCTS